MYTLGVQFRQNCAALGGYQLNEASPLTGRIVMVTFHYPPGCNALVDVQFLNYTQLIYPSSGFLALDSATPQFPLDEPVKKNDQLIVVMNNHDAVNAHQITVVVSIQGE